MGCCSIAIVIFEVSGGLAERLSGGGCRREEFGESLFIIDWPKSAHCRRGLGRCWEAPKAGPKCGAAGIRPELGAQGSKWCDGASSSVGKPVLAVPSRVRRIRS